MFGVTEFADAISDEFMGVLQTFEPGRLRFLRDDSCALRRILPVGVSSCEARTMIDVILDDLSGG